MTKQARDPADTDGSSEKWKNIGKYGSARIYWPTSSQLEMLRVAESEQAVEDMRQLLLWYHRRQGPEFVLLLIAFPLSLSGLIVMSLTFIPHGLTIGLALTVAAVLPLIPLAIRQTRTRERRLEGMMTMRLIQLADSLDERLIHLADKPKDRRLPDPVDAARDIQSAAAYFWKCFRRFSRRRAPKPLKKRRRQSARRGSTVLNSYVLQLDKDVPDYQAIADDMRRAALRVAAHHWREVEHLAPEFVDDASLISRGHQPLRSLVRQEDGTKIVLAVIGLVTALVVLGQIVSRALFGAN